MTIDDLHRDLARLLREGLAYVYDAIDDADRFGITEAGQTYLNETDDDQGARCHGVEHSESETTQRRVG